MERVYLFWLAFMINMPWISAQQIIPLNEKKYVDSLEAVLSSNQATIERVKASYKFADYWRTRDSIKSKYYLDLGKQWGKEDSMSQALYLFYEGQHFFTTNPQKAAEAFSMSAEAFSKFNTEYAITMQADSWFNYGVMLKDTKGYEFVTDMAINKSIPLIEKTGNIEKKAHYYSQLGAIFTYNAQFDKSEEYHQRAYELLKHKKYQESPILLFICLYRAMNLLYIPNSAAAKPYLEQAEKMLSKYPSSINNGFLYLVQTQYFVTTGQNEKAIASADKGISFCKNNNQHLLAQMLTFNKFGVYFSQKRYKEGKDILMGAVKEKEIMANALNRKEIYQQLSILSAELKQMDEAYAWSQKYNTINDSLNQSQFQQKLNELEEKYSASEKEKKITSLETEKELAQLSANNNRLYNWLLSISLLFTLLLIISLWSYNQKSKKLALQKETNYQQQLKEMSQLQQLNSAKAIITGEEKERKRVAQDLHDGLGGILAGIKMNLSNIANENESLNEDLQKVQDNVDYTLIELRRISRNLMPESLLKFGLNTAIKDLCDLYRLSNSKIEFESFQIADTIPQQNQLLIYRIIQELLSNAVKHSKASLILIQCSQNENRFFLTIEDNGIGFDKSKNWLNKGMGLNNIQNRVSYLNGQIEIDSVINEGTTINIELDVTK